MTKCATCSGSGMLTVPASCRRCNGTGEIIAYQPDGGEDIAVCPDCEYGTVYIEKTCDKCSGTGQV